MQSGLLTNKIFHYYSAIIPKREYLKYGSVVVIE